MLIVCEKDKWVGLHPPLADRLFTGQACILYVTSAMNSFHWTSWRTSV